VHVLRSLTVLSIVLLAAPKGIELVEIFDGDPYEETTPFTVYAPLR
jgi:hypothetical protein